MSPAPRVGNSRRLGVEAARVVLGHQSVAVTEIYAEPDRALARQVAQEAG